MFKRKNKKIEKNNEVIEEVSILMDNDIYPHDYYEQFVSDDINSYIDDLERVATKIRFNNELISKIDFNKCSDDIASVILKEAKIYNFNFNNDYFLRNGKYPKQVANNYELMKYIVDKDYNNLAYIDTDNINKEVLIDIINYAFTKVYYMKIDKNEVDFDLKNTFKNSKIVKNAYFKECYSYIDKMNKKK